MKPSSLVSLSVVLILLFLGAQSQANQNFTFTVTDASGGQGSQRDLHVLLDNEKSEHVLGWSLGVCHDPNLLTVNSVCGLRLLGACCVHRGERHPPVRNSVAPGYRSLALRTRGESG